MNTLPSAFALILALSSAAAAQTKPAGSSAATLPPGEGREAVMEFCAGACHPVDRIMNARKTPDEWRKTVLQMVSNGAQLFPEDIDTVTKYLSTNLGVPPGK
jgi:mono/diheme cytochrome c family protein